MTDVTLMPGRRRWPWAAGLVLAVMVGTLRYGNDLAIALEDDLPSTSHGTPAAGSLENGKRLPARGANFRAYSDLGALLGRNAVHHAVRDTLLDAYDEMRRAWPDTVFVYGEAGWPSGGDFAPHRTHQNGLAVDFFVPVLDRQQRSRRLPTHAFNRYGYDVEFGADGEWHGYHIDFPAMAAHLRALSDAAARRGLRIERVIFDGTLQPQLFDADGDGLEALMAFSTRRTHTRHDEHYHVVFAQR